MVKPSIRLKVVVTFELIVPKILIRSAVLEKGATDIDIADPSVLNYSVGNFCLHKFVHLKIGPEIKRTLVLHIGLLEEQTHLIRVLNLV